MAGTMIDYQVVKQWSFDEVRHSYGERECMLYALAVGLGADPKSPGELRATPTRRIFAPCRPWRPSSGRRAPGGRIPRRR